MSKAVLRVVLDTNVFSPQTYARLADSRFLELCKRGRVAPLYGHVFFDEMLRAYGNDQIRDDLLQRWLPMMVNTAPRLCDQLSAIWQRELVQGRGPHADIFMRPAEQRRLLAALAELPADGSWPGWEETRAERESEQQKRGRQRKTVIAMRAESVEAMKERGLRGFKPGSEQWPDIRDRLLDEVGRELMPSQVPSANPIILADRWASEKSKYAYYTAFAENMVYLNAYGMLHPNGQVDVNAQSDLDLMTHLLRADALVTDEKGFMATAFADLWKPRGKLIFSSDEFVSLIARF